MKTSQNMLYVFSETRRSDLVKVGTCSKGGWERFREGAFMNPRGLDVVAMWSMSDGGAAAVAEKRAHNLFPKLAGADGKEWFLSDREQAILEITGLIGRGPEYCGTTLPFSPDELYRTDRYDELSEKGDRYKGRLVQRRIWIHEERGGDFAKISQNTWWCEPGSRSTNSKSTTYNTRKMKPAACLAIPVDENDPKWEALVEDANRRTLSDYVKAVEKNGLKDRPCGRVGWTSEDPARLVRAFEELGFISLPLDADRPPRGVKSLKHPGR